MSKQAKRDARGPARTRGAPAKQHPPRKSARNEDSRGPHTPMKIDKQNDALAREISGDDARWLQLVRDNPEYSIVDNCVKLVFLGSPAHPGRLRRHLLLQNKNGQRFKGQDFTGSQQVKKTYSIHDRAQIRNPKRRVHVPEDHSSDEESIEIDGRPVRVLTSHLTNRSQAGKPVNSVAGPSGPNPGQPEPELQNVRKRRPRPSHGDNPAPLPAAPRAKAQTMTRSAFNNAVAQGRMTTATTTVTVVSDVDSNHNSTSGSPQCTRTGRASGKDAATCKVAQSVSSSPRLFTPAGNDVMFKWPPSTQPTIQRVQGKPQSVSAPTSPAPEVSLKSPEQLRHKAKGGSKKSKTPSPSMNTYNTSTPLMSLQTSPGLPDPCPFSGPSLPPLSLNSSRARNKQRTTLDILKQQIKPLPKLDLAARNQDEAPERAPRTLKPVEGIYHVPWDGESSPELLEFLNNRHSGWQLKLEPERRRTGHPVMHFDRLVLEHRTYQHLFRELGGGKRLAITDVGGNPTRHRMMGRIVHCCNPIIDVTDIFRTSNHKGLCRSRAEECVTPADTYTLIHTYVNLETIGKLVSRAKTGKIYALWHVFEDGFGSIRGFNCVEANYVHTMVGDELYVNMSVTGNSHPYNHPSNRWLNGSQGSAITTSSCTFSWALIEKVYDSSIYMLFRVPEGLQRTITPVPEFTDTIKYGEVVRNYRWGEVKLKTAYQMKFGAAGSCYISTLILAGKERVVPVPRRILEELKMQVAGKPRDANQYERLLNQFDRFMKTSNSEFPAHYDMSLIKIATVIAALMDNVEIETDILKAVERQDQISHHNVALQDLTTRQRKWPVYCLAAAVVTGGLFFAHKLSQQKSKLLCAAGVLTGAGLSVVAWNRRQDTLRARQQWLRIAEATAPDLPDSYPLGTLGGFLQVQGVSSLAPDKVLMESAGIKIVTDTLSDTEVKKCYAFGGIVMNRPVLTVFSGTAWNELKALKTRHLVAGNPINPDTMEEFKQFCAIEIKKLVAQVNHVVDYKTFQEWNSRFPPNRQKQNVRAKAMVDRYGLRENDFKRKAFIKCEAYPGRGVDAKPRLIQAVSCEANVVLGPWMWSVEAAVKEVMQGDFTFTSGLSYDDITARIPDLPATLEDDFSCFDSTINGDLIEIEQSFYRALNPNPKIVSVLDAQKKTKGITVHGIKYKCDGTRKSGDPNTSLGNTLLNALVHKYAYAKVLRVGLDFYVPTDRMRVWVNGDDNLTWLMNTPVNERQLSALKQLIGELGLKPELKMNMEYHESTYCSCWFPIAGETQGGRVVERPVFAPTPGKLLPKMAMLRSVAATAKNYKEFVRCTALGLSNAMNFDPIIGPVIRKHLELTTTLRRESYETLVQKINKRAGYALIWKDKHASVRRVATDATYDSVELRYGIGRKALEEWEQRIRKVPEIPYCVENPFYKELQIDL